MAPLLSLCLSALASPYFHVFCLALSLVPPTSTAFPHLFPALTLITYIGKFCEIVQVYFLFSSVHFYGLFCWYSITRPKGFSNVVLNRDHTCIWPFSCPPVSQANSMGRCLCLSHRLLQLLCIHVIHPYSGNTLLKSRIETSPEE